MPIIIYFRFRHDYAALFSLRHYFAAFRIFVDLPIFAIISFDSF